VDENEKWDAVKAQCEGFIKILDAMRMLLDVKTEFSCDFRRLIFDDTVKSLIRTVENKPSPGVDVNVASELNEHAGASGEQVVEPILNMPDGVQISSAAMFPTYAKKYAPEFEEGAKYFFLEVCYQQAILNGKVVPDKILKLAGEMVAPQFDKKRAGLIIDELVSSYTELVSEFFNAIYQDIGIIKYAPNKFCQYFCRNTEMQFSNMNPQKEYLHGWDVVKAIFKDSKYIPRIGHKKKTNSGNDILLGWSDTVFYDLQTETKLEYEKFSGGKESKFLELVKPGLSIQNLATLKWHWVGNCKGGVKLPKSISKSTYT